MKKKMNIANKFIIDFKNVDPNRGNIIASNSHYVDYFFNIVWSSFLIKKIPSLLVRSYHFSYLLLNQLELNESKLSL